jgi:hypothetical protein
MKNEAAADERGSETRLRVVRSARLETLEDEALEVLAQLEVLQEVLDSRHEGGAAEYGAPAVALRATVKKLRNALP